MSGFTQSEPQIKDLENCTECNEAITQDIFVLDYGRKKKKGEAGLCEARACMKCKIIFEVIA